jgi:hypothetical protein
VKPGDRIPFSEMDIGDMFEDRSGTIYVKTSLNQYRRLPDGVDWTVGARHLDIDYKFFGVHLLTLVKEKEKAREHEAR